MLLYMQTVQQLGMIAGMINFRYIKYICLGEPFKDSRNSYPASIPNIKVMNQCIYKPRFVPPAQPTV